MHGPGTGSGSITLDAFGGLVSVASPNALPEGASPRTYDTDYIIGDVLTRDHLESRYSFGLAAAGPNGGSVAQDVDVTGVAWSNVDGILANDANPAYVGASNGNLITENSDPLNVSGFAFDIPEANSVTGIGVTLTIYATAPATVTVQLCFNGVASGTKKTALIGPSTTTVSFGGATEGWANAVGPTQANAASFGIQISVVSTFPFVTVLANYATMTIYQTSGSSNFNWIDTFQADNGNILNLALDGLGNLWLEQASSAPGILTLLLEGLTPGSYGYGAAGENSAFYAISNLETGSDLPRQYSFQGWTDRISQVGPGASPVFAATTTTGSTPAAITSWAASGGIVTFQAANDFTAGEVVTLSAFGTTTAFNGQVFNVLGSGLSGTQLEVNFAGVTGSGTEAGLATPQYTYPIVASPAGITQNPQTTITFGGVLWSAAPGSQTPGTTITFYYQDSTVNAVPFFAQADPVLTKLFNSGQPVYVYITDSPVGNGTWQVTSVGIGTQPTESRQYYYFTISVPQTEYANYRGQDGAAFNYEITAATLTTVVPIPNLTVGQQFSISGAGVSNWNNLWTVTQALNSSVMAITQTSMVSGAATYSYALTGGSTAPPAPGELVTVTNTLNGGGIFNVIDVPIASVSGTNNGTFTVNGFPAGDNFGAQIESGQAQTAGTQFQFDPGQAVAGTQSSPIFGNSGGGVVSLANSSGQVISPGTKQGVVFFITRNGYYTAPSPPVQFDVPVNSNYINATLIPVGPPNVIARGIAFTESGQNGVPGANFFTIPAQVQFIVNGVTFTSSALIINDNVTTSAKFTFSDSVLLSAEAIDVQGYDLFNLIEIGSPAWIVKYASRMFYGLCQNKIQNLLNPTFDGGFIPGTQPTPLGWNADATFGSGGSLLNSPVFGNSYYIKNTATTVPAGLGMITQSAFQDFYAVPIINPNTLYSVRVTCRCPSNIPYGNLVVDLTEFNVGTGYGTVWGSFIIPIGSLTTQFQTLTGTLLLSKFETVPSDLQLRLWAQNLNPNGDVEIDRIEIFPTAQPVLNSQIWVSYANNLESVDGTTGQMTINGRDNKPVTGARVQDGILYLLKAQSWWETIDSPNTEPAFWDDSKDVSLSVGACGPNAHAQGPGWIMAASRPGLHVFTGGEPGKINHEIYQIWDTINWSAGDTIWVQNDVTERKLYIGVPLPTPNFWLPNASSNSAPTSPNVILMCNYQGIESGQDLKEGMQVHATMFGNLMAPDMRRKWSIWQIPSPFANFVQTAPLTPELMICNGIESSKIYTLEPNADGVIPTDDGAPINSLYTTYSFNSAQKVRGNPLMGSGRIRWGYGTLFISGAGNLGLRLLPNTLLGPTDSTAGYQPYTVPGGFNLTDPCLNDREFTLNFAAYRTYVEFSSAGYFDLGSMMLVGKKDVWNQIRGIK